MVRLAMVLMHMLMASTVAFSSEAQSVAARRDESPSLGRIRTSGQPWPDVNRTKAYYPVWSKREMKIITKEVDYIQHNECRTKEARQIAHQMYAEVQGDDSEQTSLEEFCFSGTKPKATSAKITVGTDFSGMEAPIQALRNIKEIKFKHVFSCDNDESSQQTIFTNFPPKIFAKNIVGRDNTQLPTVDVYVAGFPCQPFSTAGLQRGFADTKDGRGELFWEVLRYIEDRRPKIFILENVEGLTTLDEGKTLAVIMKALKNVGSVGKSGETKTKGIYDVHWKVLNTSDHGIPQNRRRWYCVGIRRGMMKRGKTFSFPKGSG